MALTANAVKGEADHCLVAGMDAYLTKPLTLGRLRMEIERWMAAAPEAAPPAEWSAEAGSLAIDRDVLRSLFGDNQAVIDRVLVRFRKAGTQLVADIAVARGDAERLGGIAHKLKGAARAAGAVRLGDLAAALEKSGDVADIARLTTEWRRVEAAISPPPVG